MTSPQSEPPRLAPSSPDLVWFGGYDSERFLNDLISQEISDLSVGETRRSFLLGPDGKVSFLLKVFKQDDRIGLLTDPGRSAELVATLSRYKIRVDVTIDIDESPRWVVVGECDGLDISWPVVRRCLVFGERPDLDEISAGEYESQRIRAGVPRWGVDIDESTIPHETGLVPLSVDFTKGCFLGQELVARIDSRGGNVPRHLRHVQLESDNVEVGTEITRDGKTVGVLTSVTATLGMGLIHRQAAVGDQVTVGDVGGVVKSLPLETIE